LPTPPASGNTANGNGALSLNTTGNNNTATGYVALQGNTAGNENTASGADALLFNAGDDNTATGFVALGSNTTGFLNTANGSRALDNNTTGHHNTAIGDSALLNNTTGSVNVAVGDFAGGNLTTGDGNIDILNPGVAGDSETIRIGVQNVTTNTFIAGIFGTNVSGSTVVVNSAGQLGVAASSRRFKKEIKPMDSASESILALKPVTFHFKSDKTNRPEFGLIAEEVAEVNPDLVVRHENGEIYTVRYDAVNAMLLNEFLKEHREMQEQKATIRQLNSTVAKQDAIIGEQQKGIETVTARLKEQAAQIQKVSARFEMDKPAPQVAENNQ
jgi:uncharacterized coiled-coil protein SlyX